jgi:two-component system, OmpR family, sensor kinase
VAPSRWTLRARLIATMVALLAVVCVVVGGLVTLALQTFLVDRLHSQVRDVAARAFEAGSGGGSEHGAGQRPPSGEDQLGPAQVPYLDAIGLPVGTVAAHFVKGGTPTGGVIDGSSRGPFVALSQPQAAVLADIPSDGSVHERTIPGLGDYVLAARAARDGDVTVAGLPLSGVHETVTRLVLVELVVAGAGLVVAGVVGSVIVRRSLAPLQRVAATARRVTSTPLDRGDVVLAERVPGADTDPRTEVGQVGLAFNRMLGHVGAALAARQASETRVRQFVADASHELRTPLASIRGYAEYAELSGGRALPEDVAHALDRVRSQTERMSELVDDLLLLARLDAGRPLDAEPVDFTRLVVDAVGDAHAAGPDHVWRLDVPDEPVEVIGDASRLHQVVGNLLANARSHTPPGTTVTITLTVPQPGADPGSAVMTVVDDGPGIPPALLADVFQRFARGEGSRTRGAGSTGLGLAIVAAVVEAHGGAVSVDSRPGRTAFEVRLPARAMAPTAPVPTAPAPTATA